MCGQYQPRKFIFMNDYILYQSEFISKNQADIMEDLRVARRHFIEIFGAKDTTWNYSLYNIFCLTAPATNFYQIYSEIRSLVRRTLGETRPLWMQAWLNYHRPHEVLDWHDHIFPYHGYVSIDPKRSNTVFENYSIENKPGQIYFGPGHRKHKVEILEPYDGERITIGFDILDTPDSLYIKYRERPFKDMSLIPLL
jgi:hypothetical protein